MGSTNQSYDFIVVGAGPAGCVLASRLANSFSQRTVLLIDAGGPNADPKAQYFGERYSTLMTPGYNWGYKTTPQKELDAREVDYSRGRGLGGSTAINFCVYTRGPSSDYDHWAEKVGDESWSWEHVLPRFKKLENFGKPLPQYKSIADISSKVHGFEGPIKVGLPESWEPGFDEYLQTVTNDKYPLNLDNNSGNPIGFAVCQVSANNGNRTTADISFLSNLPNNLTVMTNSAVERVLFEGKKAIGVEIAGQQKVEAKQEVILSAGALDTPKILMLSGVGATDELADHGISTIHNLPGIGKNLHDRLWLDLVSTRKHGGVNRTSYAIPPDTLEDARAQWIRDKTGPMAAEYLPFPIAYLKSDRILNSQEFGNLEQGVQKYFQAKTTPNYELITHVPSIKVAAPEKYFAMAIACMGTQSLGQVTLRSKDPKEPALFDPRFLSHPYDRRVAIEAVREALAFLDSPLLAEHQDHIVDGPEDGSDEEILKFVRKNGISMWHMCGTVKMGKPDDAETCVDKDFKVTGLQGLRVVDMSVAPMLPQMLLRFMANERNNSAHTQAIAYLVGEIAAEKMVAEYNEQRISAVKGGKVNCFYFED
ncbi:MAG: hypothetical protein Q9167_003647 [Letrouitia subvulpina]